MNNLHPQQTAFMLAVPAQPSSVWDSNLVSSGISSTVALIIVFVAQHLERRREKRVRRHKMLIALIGTAREIDSTIGILTQLNGELTEAAEGLAARRSISLPTYRPPSSFFADYRSALIGETDDHQLLRDIGQSEFDLTHINRRLDQLEASMHIENQQRTIAIVGNDAFRYWTTSHAQNTALLINECKERMENARARITKGICKHEGHQEIEGIASIIPGGCGCEIHQQTESIDP